MKVKETKLLLRQRFNKQGRLRTVE